MKFSIQKFYVLMAEKGMTLTRLSELTKIDIGNLSKYKNGKRKPNLKNIGKIAKALEVEITELIYEAYLDNPKDTEEICDMDCFNCKFDDCINDKF